MLPAELIAYSVLEAVLSFFTWVVTSPYLKVSGVTSLEYGFFAAVISGSSIASLPLAGWLGDRLRPVPLLAYGQVLAAVSAALLSTARLPLIMVAAAVTGFQHSLGWIPYEILLSRIVGREKYHYAYPLSFTLFQAGGVAGGLLGWVPQLLPRVVGVPLPTAYRYSILAVGASQLALIPLLARLGWGVASPPSRPTGEGVRGLRGLLGELGLFATVFKRVSGESRRVLTALALSEAIIGLGAGVGIANASYYFILKYGVGSGALGTLQAFESGLIAAVSVATPKVSERIGGTLKAYVGIASLSIPLLAAITFVNSFPIAAALYAFRTALMNAASPLLQASIMRVTPEGLRGRVNSLLAVVSDVFRVVGAPIGGYLLSRVSLEVPFRVTAAAYLIALAYLGSRAGVAASLRVRGGVPKDSGTA